MRFLFITLAGALLFFSCSSQYTITDLSGRMVTLDNVIIGSDNTLFGLIGENEITIPLDEILTLSIDAKYKRVHKGRVLYKADIIFAEGKQPAITKDTTSISNELYLDIAPKVAGETQVGSISLPMKSVKALRKVVDESEATQSTKQPAEVPAGTIENPPQEAPAE